MQEENLYRALKSCLIEFVVTNQDKTWTKRVLLLRDGLSGKFRYALEHARMLANRSGFVSINGIEVPHFAANYAYIVDRVVRLMRAHRRAEQRRSRNLRSVLAGITREQSVAHLWRLYFDKYPAYADFLEPNFENHSKKFSKQWSVATGLPASDWPGARLWSDHNPKPQRRGECKCVRQGLRVLFVGEQKWIECPVPHPSAQHSAEHLLVTYDAAVDKSIFSNGVVEILESAVMRDQLEHFILGFKSKEHRNSVTGYPQHLRAYEELYTATMRLTAADGQTSGATPKCLLELCEMAVLVCAVCCESCFSTTSACKRHGCCNISPPRLASLVMESHCYEWITTIGVKTEEKVTRGLGGHERTLSIEQWEGGRSEVS